MGISEKVIRNLDYSAPKVPRDYMTMPVIQSLEFPSLQSFPSSPESMRASFSELSKVSLDKILEFAILS